MRIFLIVIFLTSWFATPTHAQVIINEVFPAPSEGAEWVELYNAGPEAVNLNQWSLEDQLSTPSLIQTLPDQVFQPLSYLVIEFSAAKLNNSADGVTLKNAEGDVHDTMSYTSSSPDQSWARRPDATGIFSLSAATKGLPNGQPDPSPSPSPSPSTSPNPSPSPSPTLVPTPTPSPNPTPSPEPFFSLTLTEIMACPASGDTEWIEVFNPSSDTRTLNNWQVRDSSGTSKTVSATILPQSYGVLSWSGSLLNNTGDSVTLLNANNQPVTSASFPSCSSGQSFIWQNSSWQLTSTPTKGATNPTNPVDQPEDEDETDDLTSDTDVDQETSGSLTSQSNTWSGTAPPTPTLINPATSNSHAADWDPSTVHLNLDSPNPLLHPPQVITLNQPIFSKWGVVNVILGGVLLATAGSYLIYETTHS